MKRTQQAKPKLILLCGLPGAGKTTLAKKLAVETPATRFCPDEWMYKHGIDLQDKPIRERVEKDMWQDAQKLLKNGENVILEYGFWGKTEREEKGLEAQALGTQVELHYLNVPLQELLRRLERRNQQHDWNAVPITRQQLKEWAKIFQPPDAKESMLYKSK